MSSWGTAILPRSGRWVIFTNEPNKNRVAESLPDSSRRHGLVFTPAQTRAKGRNLWKPFCGKVGTDTVS